MRIFGVLGLAPAPRRQGAKGKGQGSRAGLCGASGASISGQPCLADGVKDGEVLLTKALIFLSLLYAFY